MWEKKQLKCSTVVGEGTGSGLKQLVKGKTQLRYKWSMKM